MSEAQILMTSTPICETAASRSEAFARARKRLKSEIGEAVYSSWFASLELDGVHEGCAMMSVPTKFLKSWIRAHYLDRLRAVIVEELPGATDIELMVRGAGRPAPHKFIVADKAPGVEAAASPRPAPCAATHSAGEIGQGAGFGGSPLDRRMTFATFLVGPSNQLAYAAASQITRHRSGESALYNPLYIHSAVGLGKTHLLQATAQACIEAGKRVTYLTAEKFMYGFVSALKTQNALAFKDKLRAIDVLVIDDMQFLQGKSIQQEFCHTLNALIDAGRQVVIAADRSPAELENLEERVRSRLAGGLCVEMQALDEALRVAILEARIGAAKLAHPGFDVSPRVVTLVAKAIETNGRDLDGAVNRLLAHSQLAGSVLNLEAAEAAIRDLVRVREPKRVKIEDIQKLVATHFNVSRADILSSRRTANVVLPRQIAMYLSKTMTLRSLPEIGRRFGGRDHTTVLHAVRKIEGLVGKNSSLNEEIELLKRMLSD